MKRPLYTNSMCALVWLRADLDRAESSAYWRTTHGQLVTKLSSVDEYLQHHFSTKDRGFWPTPKGIGGLIPADWQIDGLTEVRTIGLLSSFGDRFLRMKPIFRDEFNVFDRVIPNAARPNGGAWWTGPFQQKVGFRTVVLIRARHEYKGKPFNNFIEHTLAPALLSAGALELRTHVFQPGARFMQWTPDVRHDHPANRRYAGAVMIGTKDRAEFEKILKSKELQATQSAQAKHCIAIHAYAVENTYPIILGGEPQPVTWE